MVLLDEDRVVKPHAVVSAASRRDRCFLEQTKAGNRLSSVEDLGPARTRGLDELRGERRDAGEMPQKVESGSLTREDRPGRPGHAGNVARHVVTPYPLGYERLEPRGARQLERLGGDAEAENDPGPLLDDASRDASVGGDDRLGGDVAGAQVLGERPGYEL